MPDGQVSVWVPIAVGLIGVAGVVTGQVLSTARERRNEQLRWARQDQLAWREKRLAIALGFLITLNAWRELAVDSWHQADKRTLSLLHDSVTRMSDQLAEIKLVGTDRMRTAATDAVDVLLATSASARESRDFDEASRRLSAIIRTLRETFRAELGIPDQP